MLELLPRFDERGLPSIVRNCGRSFRSSRPQWPIPADGLHALPVSGTNRGVRTEGGRCDGPNGFEQTCLNGALNKVLGTLRPVGGDD